MSVLHNEVKLFGLSSLAPFCTIKGAQAQIPVQVFGGLAQGCTIKESFGGGSSQPIWQSSKNYILLCNLQFADDALVMLMAFS